MYSGIQLALKYVRYYLTASNGKGHGTHSPFVFEFITKVLNDKSVYPEYGPVEKLRQELLLDKTMLTVEDLGAGSVVSKTNQRTVASIARNAAKPKKFGQLLFRIARYYQLQRVIELGTSLGISAGYLAKGIGKEGTLTTVEGAASIAAVARQNFEKLGLDNIALINRSFDEAMPELQKPGSGIDLLFIDGNHRKDPTIRYYNSLLPYMNTGGMMIFDDIHWSREMEEAWEHIKQQPAVRCTIDLFFIGIVLFSPDFKEKQHFSIRF